jgi:hypothetical protein
MRYVFEFLSLFHKGVRVSIITRRLETISFPWSDIEYGAYDSQSEESALPCFPILISDSISQIANARKKAE